MHYTLTVALPGTIAPQDLRPALEKSMARFDENRRVDLHRDTSVYAQPMADHLAAAKASASIKAGDNWIAGLSDEEIAREWSGAEKFDPDGWPLTTHNPDGQWDWWVIGGRWGGSWHLRPGAQDGPLATDGYSTGRAERADEKDRTDNARWRDIVPESVTPSYAWLDLAGEWHTRWVGPTREEALTPGMPDRTGHWEAPQKEHHAAFMKFLADLPGDTWLVLIDFHN